MVPVTRSDARAAWRPGTRLATVTGRDVVRVPHEDGPAARVLAADLCGSVVDVALVLGASAPRGG
jgi:hypothetical protein